MPLARLRRPVERASQRQAIADRIVIAVLVVVAASGLMSLLPGDRQATVSRFVCRLGSLGLGACSSAPPVLGSQQLAPPRCRLLSTFDEALPEVRVSNPAAAGSPSIELSTARSGDMYLRLGIENALAPPFLLQGEGRATAPLLPGASVPVSAEWYLPAGQGANVIAQAVADRHHQWVQRRSSLAVISSVFGDRGRRIPPPTVLFSQVRLDSPVLPRVAGGPSAPSTSAGPDRPGESYISVVSSRPALLAYNRITADASLVVSVAGAVLDTPVAGSVRWTRDASGAITSVLIAVVSEGRLVPGERLPKDGSSNSADSGSTGVAYVAVRVTSAAEQDLVSDWLSDPQGFSLGLDELLGLRAPQASDQLGSYLTRAATVTLLRYSGIDSQTAETQVSEELARHRRVDWSGGRLLSVSEIAPEPNRAARVLVTDQAVERNDGASLDPPAGARALPVPAGRHWTSVDGGSRARQRRQPDVHCANDDPAGQLKPFDRLRARSRGWLAMGRRDRWYRPSSLNSGVGPGRPGRN